MIPLAEANTHRAATTGCESLQYRDLFQHMREGLAYCEMLYGENGGLDFRYLEVNPAFERLTGLQDVTGKRATEVIPDIQKLDLTLLRRYAQAAETRVPDKFEIYLGSMATWFSISVYSPKQGFFVAIFDVITDRMEAERALRQSETALRSLFDHAPFAYHELDGHGVVTRVNGTECDLLGFSAADMVGRPIWEFVVPEQRDDSRANILGRINGTEDLTP